MASLAGLRNQPKPHRTQLVTQHATTRTMSALPTVRPRFDLGDGRFPEPGLLLVRRPRLRERPDERLWHGYRQLHLRRLRSVEVAHRLERLLLAVHRRAARRRVGLRPHGAEARIPALARRCPSHDSLIANTVIDGCPRDAPGDQHPRRAHSSLITTASRRRRNLRRLHVHAHRSADSGDQRANRLFTGIAAPGPSVRMPAK